jgi:Na+-translocating ferredoxin:NAD+ oxidoreductase subunit D
MTVITVSPHIHSGNATHKIMRDVLIALTPAALVAIWLFSWPALLVMVVSVATSVAAEYVFQKCAKKPITINDLSAVVTGLLLAFCLPPTTPWWAVFLGALFATVVVKQFFGGIGCNIFNPALAGRAFLMASYPIIMTTWVRPFDAVTTATPLGALKEHLPLVFSLKDLFLGTIGGSLGETSALALLIGAAYLLLRRVIDWRIPTAYLGTVALLMTLLGQNVPYHLLAGGLILGAFFMATDYTTTPMRTKGQLIFGLGCGIITVVIRLWGGYPEGVCYSILIMNMFVPLLDRLK